MAKWIKDTSGEYVSYPTGEKQGLVFFFGRSWRAEYGNRGLGDFKTLKRAKAWIEEVAPLMDAGEGWGTGPESERGPDWFANDGIDYREAA